MTIVDTRAMAPTELVDKPKDVITQAAQRASELVTSFVMDRLNYSQALICQLGNTALDMSEERSKVYDSQAVVRRAAEKVALALQEDLPRGIFRMGSSQYMMIEDVHARMGNGNWLIQLNDEANVSFMELRGLTGDNEMTKATFDHQASLLQDVMSASQTIALT